MLPAVALPTIDTPFTSLMPCPATACETNRNSPLLNASPVTVISVSLRLAVMAPPIALPPVAALPPRALASKTFLPVRLMIEGLAKMLIAPACALPPVPVVPSALPPYAPAKTDRPPFRKELPRIEMLTIPLRAKPPCAMPFPPKASDSSATPVNSPTFPKFRNESSASKKFAPSPGLKASPPDAPLPPMAEL